MTYPQAGKILTPRELVNLRRPLPKSWVRAAGMLRHKRNALEKHLRKVRLEWDHTHARV